MSSSESLQFTESYPNIRTIFLILLTIPVSSATVERGNSAVKDIKTAKRSTMGSPRLNALLLLYIHKDIALDYDKIVNTFANRKPSRMAKLNPFGQE